MSDPPANPAVLAFSPGVWGWPDFAGSPRYHLWTLAGRGWPVLFVEPPVKWRMKAKLWTAPDRPFHVLSPARVPPFQFRAAPLPVIAESWRRLTARRLWSEGALAIQTLSLAPQICWLGAPWHEPLAIEATAQRMHVVTHSYDELSVSPALTARQGELLWKWEQSLHRRAAIAFCSSEPQRRRRAAIGANATLLENAVSSAFFQSPDPRAESTPHVDISSCESPRIVYGGVVDHRLDTALLEALANDLRGGSLTFAGVVDRSFPSDVLEWLKNARGVRFLGRVPYASWPEIFAQADVLILAHKRTPFTDAMYPEKINEYLASGKPVVAVPLPEVHRLAEEAGDPAVLRVAEPDQFLAAVHHAVTEDSRDLQAARIALAKRRTWDAVGDVLERELRGLLSPRDRG